MRRFAKIATAIVFFGTMSAVAAPDQPQPVETQTTSPGQQMSSAQMNVASAEIEVRLEEDSTGISHLQEVAKKQKDVIKLNCVNDRMVQAKAQRNIADDTRAQLNAALAKNSDERFTLFQQLEATASSVKTLHEQAKACVGELELYKQESGVTVDHPPIVDDPTVTTPPIEGTFEPPAYTSPFF